MIRVARVKKKELRRFKDKVVSSLCSEQSVLWRWPLSWALKMGPHMQESREKGTQTEGNV